MNKQHFIFLFSSHVISYNVSQARPWPAVNWKFYVAFSLFRGASIYAGVYHRFTMVCALSFGF
jgi:hypothetical protein